jgi:MscS family membrane protein
MRFSWLTIRFTLILLAAALVVIGAEAQESATTEVEAKQPPQDYSLENATAQHPLKPPETSSPRATLTSFIDNVNRSYSVLMAAHKKNLMSPGFFTQEEVETMADNATGLLERAIWCLNLSEVPPIRRKDVAYEAALKLKEILDRIELPPFDQIPDAEAVASELEEKKYPRFLRWQVPYTHIEIGRVEAGPRTGSFLFTPQTIDRLDDFHDRVKHLPYKSDVFTTPDFLDFYVSTPGRLLPPKWSRLLPAWSNKLYYEQTIWQWVALIVLSLLTLLVTLVLFFRLHPSSDATLAAARRYWRRILFYVLVAGAIKILAYVLETQINLTAEVLSVIGYTLAIIRYFLVSAAVLFIGSAIAESIISSPKIDPEGIQASYLRALCGLLGFIAAAAIFITGLYRIGVSLIPLLTGLGFGGLAFALAARPTLENIIGSFMIFVDKPYRVGQRVNVLGQQGDVEAIGLRSTKIRLLSGHLTSIPNEKMASVEIENIGRRPYIRRVFNITITYDTPPGKIARALNILREILALPEVPDRDTSDSAVKVADTSATEGEAENQSHPNEAINQPDFPPRVYFNDLNADSLNILVMYWYHPPEYWDYLEHATWINMHIMERFNAEEIDFAFPTQTLHMAGDEKRPLTVGQRWVSEEESFSPSANLAQAAALGAQTAQSPQTAVSDSVRPQVNDADLLKPRADGKPSETPLEDDVLHGRDEKEVNDEEDTQH